MSKNKEEMPVANIEERAQAQIAEALPGALAKALEFYQRLIEISKAVLDKGESDPKTIKAYQEACKAGVAHIELIYRLAQKMGAGGEESGGTEIEKIHVAALLKNAEAEIRKWEDRKKEE